MAGYWNDPALRFASGGAVTRGWTETLERYRARYPDRATMGTLELTVIELDLVSPDAAVVLGRWRLARAADAPSGLFTLVLRRLGDEWRIVHDHTSSE